MAVSQGLQLFAIFLTFPGLQSLSQLQICPESCTCQSDSLLNCSSAGVSSAPQHINNSITELDLSNNLLGSLTLQSKYYNLQKVWLGNNSFIHLSLCMGMDVRFQPVSRLRRGLGPLRRWGCLLWAPTLQLLSVERNQLEKLPEGLGQQISLQILNLSFNKISILKPQDFSHLKQLKELHLQYNLITSLHPETFENLVKLKVLDLSFNLLTSLHPMTYLSLRDIGADVILGGNRWLCDCQMSVLQRWLIYDYNRGLKAWSIVCDSPFANSGQDLLNLHEDDLECHDSDTNLHHDITAYSGSELLLTCSEQDATWWMPNGQASRSHPGELVLPKITEQDAGLYVCVSKSQHKVISIYNVQIRERKPRSLPGQHGGTLDRLKRAVPKSVTQSNFDMAVSLSVIITFIIAFILGVLARPCICALWAKTKTKKQTSPKTNSSVQQGQYDNEAYLHCDDPADIELAHRERRVTFSDITEEGNMQYYDTVAVDLHEANSAVSGSGHSRVNIESSDDSGSEEDNRKHTKQGTTSGSA